MRVPPESVASLLRQSTQRTSCNTEGNREGIRMTQVLCKECYDPFPVARYRLGYTTCLSCGDKQARAVTYCSAPINKSSYMLITDINTLSQLNPKRTT
jgi:hypothetical protein